MKGGEANLQNVMGNFNRARILYLMTILSVCNVFTTYAQKPSVRIGIKLLPGITDSHNPNEQQNFDNRVHPRFTFNFGGHVITPIKDSTMFIECGIYYADRGSVQRDFISEYYTPQGNYTKVSDIYVHKYYLSLPISFRYERRYFYASMGGIIDYYSHTKWVWTPEEDSIETSNWRPSGFSNSFKFGVIATAGVQFRVNDKINLFLEANVSASDIYRDPVNRKYYFFWNHLLGTGVTFRL